MIFDGISPVSTMMPTPVSHIQAARKNVAPPPSNGSKRSAVFIQRINGSDSTSRPIAFIHRINEGVVIKQFQLSQQQQMQQIHPVVDSQDESNDASDFGINGGLTTDHLDIGATQEVPSCGSSDYDNYNGGHSRYLSVEGNPLGTTTIIRRLAAPNNRHSFLFQPQSHSSLSNLGVLSNNSFTHGSNVAAAGHVAFLPDVMEPEYHQLGIRIQHLNIRVKDAIINSPAAPDPIETQIPHHVSDANKAYVDLLLENMVRGIVLSATHGSIYVERMCKCAVFVYVPTSDGDHIFMRKLGRREREKIFDYDDFMQDLECYQAGQRPRPHFEIILAFGQQLRSGLSTDNLLVWCRVASCRAWFHLHKVSGYILLLF
ncbi:unnamed protein product [Protopolystoma xenopodis]|uniref:Interferon regulatory factor-3 domain-containing protein n=1 Tax=Protopolystoma xenopodis TaxID=117903 RepID=A0A448X2I8_9PLAT|nr:unnamed protein product [Protopolystoma xenopodis]